MPENLIQVIIPIIGIITAIISATFSYYFTKRNQLEANERKLKEKYYLAYIKAVSDVVIIDNKKAARNNLADAQNQLLLTGSSEVVNNLMKFHDYIKPSGQEEHGFSSMDHDKLLTELIKSMRKDLYKNKNCNIEYPMIHLTGKN